MRKNDSRSHLDEVSQVTQLTLTQNEFTCVKRKPESTNFSPVKASKYRSDYTSKNYNYHSNEQSATEESNEVELVGVTKAHHNQSSASETDVGEDDNDDSASKTSKILLD